MIREKDFKLVEDRKVGRLKKVDGEWVSINVLWPICLRSAV
jgi:hypothetical protein